MVSIPIYFVADMTTVCVCLYMRIICLHPLHTPQEAALAQKEGEPIWTLAQAESAVYYYNRRLLEEAGCEVNVEGKMVQFQGIPFQRG
jgi:hypothetical protein